MGSADIRITNNAHDKRSIYQRNRIRKFAGISSKDIHEKWQHLANMLVLLVLS